MNSTYTAFDELRAAGWILVAAHQWRDPQTGAVKWTMQALRVMRERKVDAETTPD